MKILNFASMDCESVTGDFILRSNEKLVSHEEKVGNKEMLASGFF